MEQGLREPLLDLVLDDECQEYTEWTLFLRDSVVTGINSGYDNSYGTPAVDPEMLSMLQQKVETIKTWSSLKHGVLYLILLFANGAIPFLKSPGLVLTVLLGPYVIFHLISNYVIFKKTDAELLALMDSCKGTFLKKYRATLGHNKCTHLVRWWNDDSGIALRLTGTPRRPRRVLTLCADSGADELHDGVTRVSITLDIPSHVHGDKLSPDAPTRADANTSQPLQAPPKEMIQPFAFCKAFFLILIHGLISFGIFLPIDIHPTTDKFWLALVLTVPLIILLSFIALSEHIRNRKIAGQQITQHVTTAVQEKKHDADGHSTLKLAQ
jgi:hypothetical protein